MSHRNARLNVRGRLLIVARVIEEGRPVSHVAKELGVSRQCAHRWLNRFLTDGAAGLEDRSSRPHHSPRQTSPHAEKVVLQMRAKHRRGQDWIGPEIGLSPRTVSSILRRHDVPYLCECEGLPRVRLTLGVCDSQAAFAAA